MSSLFTLILHFRVIFEVEIRMTLPFAGILSVDFVGSVFIPRMSFLNIVVLLMKNASFAIALVLGTCIF